MVFQSGLCDTPLIQPRLARTVRRVSNFGDGVFPLVEGTRVRFPDAPGEEAHGRLR